VRNCDALGGTDAHRKFHESRREFYTPFGKDLVEKKKDDTKIEIQDETAEVCPKCGKPMQIRASRFGRFYACSGYPECKTTKPILKKVAGKICPKCGGDVVTRYSKAKRKFYGCSNYPTCDYVEFAWNKLAKAT
jgi:DNA topoisomerase-1